MRITTKGQVTIPHRFRLKFGLLPNTDVSFEEVDGGVTIRPVLSKRALIEDRLRRGVRLFCVGGPEGSRRGCERHGKSYLTRRRRGEEGDGGGSLTGGAIPSA